MGWGVPGAGLNPVRGGALEAQGGSHWTPCTAWVATRGPHRGFANSLPDAETLTPKLKAQLGAPSLQGPRHQLEGGTGAGKAQRGAAGRPSL